MNCISFWKVVVRNFDYHSFQPRLRQFLCCVLTQDFLHGQGDDDCVVVFEEAVDLAQGVFGVIEGDEEAFLALGAAHGGLEGIYVRAANFVVLLHLSGESERFQGGVAILFLATWRMSLREFPSQFCDTDCTLFKQFG